MNQRVVQQKHFMARKGNDIYTTQMQNHSIMFMLPYFSIVKIPLRSVTFRRAVVSSRLNTGHVRSPQLASGAFSISSNTPLFPTALPLPWRMLLVLERVSIHNANFVVENPSYVKSEFCLYKYFFSSG